MKTIDVTTLGLAAVKIGGGVQIHHLRRLANSGRITVVRAGRIRLVRLAALPRIRKVCEEAGYYSASEQQISA